MAQIIEQKVPNLNEIDSGQSEPFNAGQNQEKFGVAEAIQIGAIVIPALVSWLSNRNTNRANKEIHDADNAFNAEQSLSAFNRNAAYNSPSAERQRLSDAGINPALYYNGGSSDVSQSSPSAAGAIPMQAYNMSPMDLAQMSLLNAQARNINAQTDTIPLEQEKIRAEIEHMCSQDDVLRTEVDKMRKDMDLTDNQILLICDQREQLMHEVDNMIAQKKVYLKQLEVMAADIEEKKSNSKYLRQMAAYFQQMTIAQGNENSLFPYYQSWQLSNWNTDIAQNQITQQYLYQNSVQILNNLKNTLSAESSDAEKASELNNYINGFLHHYSELGAPKRVFRMPELFLANYIVQMASGTFSSGVGATLSGAGIFMRGLSSMRGGTNSTVTHYHVKGKR